MDHSDIPDEHRQYIRKRTYNAMTNGERMLYLKYIKKLVQEMNSANMLHDRPRIKVQPRVESGIISLIDIRFGEGCVFDSDDIVHLERCDDNPRNLDAVKVMLKQGKTWKRVAYVDPDDAKWLRTIDGFEQAPLQLMLTYPRVQYNKPGINPGSGIHAVRSHVGMAVAQRRGLPAPHLRVDQASPRTKST